MNILKILGKRLPKSISIEIWPKGLWLILKRYFGNGGTK